MRTKLSDLSFRLESRLSKAGYRHSIRTAAAARDLAALHGLDEERAETAGLIHDYAKDMAPEQLVQAARRFGLPINEVEARKPYLLHAAVGAEMAAAELGVDDEEILGAVRNHTFGSCGMSRFDKIVFLADVIEPRRNFAGLGLVRELAKNDIDKAFAAAYKGQVIFVVEKGGYLHPETLNVWNWLVDEVKDFD